MMEHVGLRASLIDLINVTDAKNPSTGDVAFALTNVLCNFAEVLRGPAPEVVTGYAPVADDTQALILAELKKLNAHIESLRAAGNSLLVTACE